MGEMEKALEILDQHYEDYRAMYRVGLEQRDCIAREDLSGLEVSFERMHRLTDRIRRRQAGMPELGPGGGAAPGELQQRHQNLRHIIGELQEVRQSNERAVKRLLQRTRDELRQFGKGQRAARGYRRTRVQDARFFDGTR